MRAPKLCNLFAVVTLVLIGCSGGASVSGKLEYMEPEFKKEINADVKVLNNDFLFNYGKIQVIDTMIVYSGLTDVSDKTFHVFSKNTGKYLTSFGNVGRAYGEISQPGVAFTADKENRTLYVYDSRINKTVSYSLDKVMAGVKDYARELNLPDAIGNTTSTRFLYLNKSFLAGESYSGRFLICTENDSITCSDFYPDLGIEPQEYKKVEQSYFLFAGCMAAKPDGRMFVHATLGGCVFEIWNNAGDSISPYVVKGFFKPEYDSRYRDMNYPTVIPKNGCGISALCCSDKNIYALYTNESGTAAKRIAVFDWKGNPQRLYVLKDNPLALAVDEDHIVFALTENKDGNIKLVAIGL